jgi:hypothetical protein
MVKEEEDQIISETTKQILLILDFLKYDGDVVIRPSE